MATRVNEYPRPHPIVSLIRAGWTLFVLLLAGLGIIALGGMIFWGGGWWIVPIVAAVGYGFYVLHRNRRRSRTGPADVMATQRNDYPQPHPLVSLTRGAWMIVVAVLIALGIGVLITMIVAGAWWILPIVVVFGYAVFVLMRNRGRI
jgi:Ca2+/Na+ antiporter